MFAPLSNPDFFKKLSIESGGYGLVWNDEIDISEYELWRNGVTLMGEESERFLELPRQSF